HIISWSIKTHLPPFITIIFPSFIVIVPSATVDIIEDDVELIESELIFLSVIEESAVDSVFEEPLLQEVTKAAMVTIAINFFIRFYFKVLKFNRFKVCFFLHKKKHRVTPGNYFFHQAIVGY